MKTVNFKVSAQTADRCKRRGIKIRRADRTGDSTLAVVDPSSTESIQVGVEELEKFIGDCVSEFGMPAPVFAGRFKTGQDELSWGPFDVGVDDITDVEDVMVHEPLVGG